MATATTTAADANERRTPVAVSQVLLDTSAEPNPI
jgi:hypothetical protein